MEEKLRETKADISELKLPDGVKPDEELQIKPDITTNNNNSTTQIKHLVEKLRKTKADIKPS